MNPDHPTQRVRFFLGGVGSDATEAQIYTAFADVGVTLRHVHLVVNGATGCSRGFAFVSVDSPPFGPGAMPQDLLDRMGGVTVNDRASMVCFVAGPYAASLQWSAGRGRELNASQRDGG
ncbi:MAG: RNA recognition motif domain-containing protein [Polyangiaceae bacterium]